MSTATLNITERYVGPLLLKQGFRMFFLGATFWAAVSMLLWIATLAGQMVVPTAFTPIDWHIHELLFGYSSAVVGGFLLTAAPNWTGRSPISGNRLLLLFCLWLAGRVVVGFSSLLPAVLVGIVDIAYLLVLAIVIATELIAANKRSNLPVVVVVLILTLANLVFHVEATLRGNASLGASLGISAILLLIMIIGGRIVPAFTRNWLIGQGAVAQNMLVQFALYDKVTIIVSVLALLCWSFLVSSEIVSLLSLLAAGLNIFRQSRWFKMRVVSEPLLLILHIGYAFIPLGFLAVAISAVLPQIVPPISAVHLWTAGAVGVMTMAVMTRASLGHTGQALHADVYIIGIYAALLVSIFTRFIAGYGISVSMLLNVSALAWCAAHLGFVLRYLHSFRTAG